MKTGRNCNLCVFFFTSSNFDRSKTSYCWEQVSGAAKFGVSLLDQIGKLLAHFLWKISRGTVLYWAIFQYSMNYEPKTDFWHFSPPTRSFPLLQHVILDRSRPQVAHIPTCYIGWQMRLLFHPLVQLIYVRFFQRRILFVFFFGADTMSRHFLYFSRHCKRKTLAGK